MLTLLPPGASVVVKLQVLEIIIGNALNTTSVHEILNILRVFEKYVKIKGQG